MAIYTNLLASAIALFLSASAAVQAQGSCCTAQCPMGATDFAPAPFAQNAISGSGMRPAGVATKTYAQAVNVPAAPGSSSEGAKAQELNLEVTNSYNPNVLTVKKGVPVALKVHRKDADNCGGELLIPDFGVRAKVPAGQTTVVKFTPTKAGTFAFTCGMQMMKGQLVVKNGP